jgi:K+-transporting ATPase KdpF subunit
MMKPKIVFSFMPLAVEHAHSGDAGSNGPVSYIIGGIIALLILAYLIYTLLHPEKF